MCLAIASGVGVDRAGGLGSIASRNDLTRYTTPGMHGDGRHRDSVQFLLT